MLDVAGVRIGEGAPLALIAGPCVLEEPDRVYRIAAALQAIATGQGFPVIFKSSFDKANRTALHSYRGPGLDDGLEMLAAVRERFDLPLTTDVHLPEQAGPVAEVVDLLQVPAFLCRQTDLLQACAATGKPVNVKKGQFMAPLAMSHVVEKLEGAAGVMLTERGTSFGHGDLVVDFRGIVDMLGMDVPVCFDCTHSVQQPPSHGDHSGGQRRYVPALARAAVAVGVHCLFMEVHDEPGLARSDAATQLPLTGLAPLLRDLASIRAASEQV